MITKAELFGYLFRFLYVTENFPKHLETPGHRERERCNFGPEEK